MPPKPKDPKKGLYKQGTPLKDVIPATIKQPPREGKPVRPTEFTPTTPIINQYQPQQEFEEWPGDEAALNFDFGLESQAGKVFTDPVSFPVPPSFKARESDIIFWRRPKELVRRDVTEASPSLTSLGAKSKLRKQRTGVDGVIEGRMSICEEDTGLGLYEKEEMEIVMFETYEREETAEEAELRVKEIMERQQQQKKKPAGKKEEPIDTNPIRIKDVRLSNISMKEEVPAYSKWIASQLQVIKDLNMRDVNSQKPIWSRIYPQKEGVPVVNPSGRYWVKMYYMGKERKIEVDDRVPVVFGESLFARSVKDNEIWTYVLAKAIIKLNSGRWVDPKVKDVEVGDGSIIYALTGYLPETVNISANLQDKWRSISHALSDKNYNSGEKYITCFCMPDFRPSAPSNRAKIAREVSLDSKRGSNKRDSVRSQTVVRSVPRQSADNLDPKGLGIGKDGQVKRKDPPSATILRSPRQDNPLSKRDDGRERPSHVVTGFAYAVVDTFENENFNMVYALKRTEQEVKLRTDLANLQKVSMNKMSKEEKIEHRKLVKDMKEKWAVEDARRREMVKVPAEHYKLLKIKSSAGKVSALSFNTFDQEDVTLARKCILNKLTKPPNYDMYDVKQDEKSASSAQVETQKILPLDDFSKVENFKEPVRRPAGGTWLTDQDLEGCFQYLQVFHDPTRFKYKETHAIAARQDEELVGFEDKEVIIIEAVPEEEEKDKEKEKDHAIAHHSFLYSFAATRPSNMGIELKPSFVLQKYDFQRFEVAQAYKPLNQPHDSDCLTLDNKNQVFRVQLTSPMSCYLWICSNLHYRLTSVADFLCTYEGYQTKTQQIDYPVIEKNRYHLFYKGIINALSQKERIICRIKSSTDNVILRSIRIKLVEITQKDYVSSEDFKTGVVSFPLEKAYYASKTASITLEPEKRYMIVIEGRMPETANEGVLDFDIMFQNPEFGIEAVEQVEPLEYVDKYVPTKYGVLFSERLFLNNEVQASFFVRISDILGNSAQQATQKGKKPEVSQVEEREITEQRTIKLELIRDNQLVAYAFGQNKAVLSNVGLYPTNNKDEARSYLLQARFDLREWPEAKEESEQTCNLHWTLKVSSSDTIVVIKDTIKEDNIKAIKKSWEEKEPGRAEKAKTARRKYLILEKIKKGEPVDQEEMQLINEPRQRKNKEEEQKKDPKGKAAPPKGKAPPPAKGGKKEEAPVEEKKEERPVPKSYDHVMGEICTFLTHMENSRLLEEGDDGEGPKVRTEEERMELREKVLLGKEEVYGMVDRNKQVKQKIKDILTEKKEKTLVDMQVKRQETKEKLSAMMKEREEFRKKDKEIKDKERAVIALCKNEKPNLEDVVKSLSENTGVVDPGLLKVLERVRKNAYIGDKVERISSALVAYDIPVLTAVLEEIKNEEIDIDAELYDKAEEMIDMAEKNPTFIAEKQKEAQKAVKGKKK